MHFLILYPYTCAYQPFGAGQEEQQWELRNRDKNFKNFQMWYLNTAELKLLSAHYKYSPFLNGNCAAQFREYLQKH